jgi:EAL domain-containing protein (putative c-di-GMP-specific phosphodiesterase class I)
MRNPAEALSLMKSLQALGVRIAMDDFGTGTSSLAFLRDYPFNTIKIDRTFVKDLEASNDVLAVIHATISLVENLGMVSVAEGVENMGQLAVLQSLGCRYGQGYLFSRPVQPAQLLHAIAGGMPGRSPAPLLAAMTQA